MLPSSQPVTRTRYVPGDMIPPTDVLRVGKFTAKGMAAAFEDALARPMQDHMKTKERFNRFWYFKDCRGQIGRATVFILQSLQTKPWRRPTTLQRFGETEIAMPQ